MKGKSLLLVISVLLFSHVVFSVDFMNLEIGCERDYCIPNRVTEWNLTITNLGESKLSILGFRIKDAINSKEALCYEAEKPVEIVTYLSHIFSIRSKLPYPSTDNKLIFNVCLVVEPPKESWGSAGKEIEHCYDDINFTFITTPCLDSPDCADDNYCQNMECINLNCSYCQYPSEHVCKDYSCCQNSECLMNEVCDSHECIKLECHEEEYIVNHTCSNTACALDEGVINFTCVLLDCGYDETIFNHECVKLDCGYDEHALNYSCIPLNCSYDEYALDHSCFPLNCSDTEAYLNHSCSRLDCSIFQKAQQHECRINSFIILEAFLLFMIYFLVTLNIEKYLYIKRKKLVGFFLRKKKAKKEEDIKTEKKEDSKGENNG